MGFPSVAGGGGHYTVIAINYAEWSCIVECVCLRAIVGGGGALFWEAYQDAVVEVVAISGIGIMVSVGKVVLCRV